MNYTNKITTTGNRVIMNIKIHHCDIIFKHYQGWIHIFTNYSYQVNISFSNLYLSLSLFLSLSLSLSLSTHTCTCCSTHEHWERGTCCYDELALIKKTIIKMVVKNINTSFSSRYITNPPPPSLPQRRDIGTLTANFSCRILWLNASSCSNRHS